MYGNVIKKLTDYVITTEKGTYYLYKINSDKVLSYSRDLTYIYRAYKKYHNYYKSYNNELVKYTQQDLFLLYEDYLTESYAREIGQKYRITIFKGKALSSYALETNSTLMTVVFRSKFELLLFLESIFVDVKDKAYTLMYDLDVKNRLKDSIIRTPEIRFIQTFKNSTNHYSIDISDSEYHRGIYSCGFCKSNLKDIKEQILKYDIL